MFHLCCDNRKTESYSIIHTPRPVHWSADMEDIIKNILWYVPNISSYQSPKNELVEDKVYDAFSFTFILDRMGMKESTDVLWHKISENVSDSDWEFFEEEICTECQKMILTRMARQSKTNNLLRCLRNCVAHGYFAIVGDYFIGFNLITPTDSPPEKKAVIKIKPELLLNALRELMSPRAKEMLVGYALERVGYTLSYEPYFSRGNGSSWRFDLLAEKDGRKYAIEIKDYRGTRYLHKEQLARMVSVSNQMDQDMETVLFIDTSYVTKDVREWAASIENFRIVDIRDIRQLLAEEPVDILRL